jgi:hypothetical protein
MSGLLAVRCSADPPKPTWVETATHSLQVHISNTIGYYRVLATRRFYQVSLQISEEDYGIELMTSMELVDAASAQTPIWVTFSISTVTRGSDQ